MFQTILSLGAQTVPDATLATEMHGFLNSSPFEGPKSNCNRIGLNVVTKAGTNGIKPSNTFHRWETIKDEEKLRRKWCIGQETLKIFTNFVS